MVQIDKALNLVIPVERENSLIYVFSTPISRAVFEANFLVISKTFCAIYAEGIAMSGPSVAALTMRTIAKKMEITDEIEGRFFAEVRRMTTVLAPSAQGWETLSLHDAIGKKLLDDEELTEVENALTFFMLISRCARRVNRRGIMEGAVMFWGGQVTSLDCTAFRSSLPTSTATETSPRPAASSVPT